MDCRRKYVHALWVYIIYLLIEPVREKTNNLGSDKLLCTVTEEDG